MDRRGPGRVRRSGALGFARFACAERRSEKPVTARWDAEVDDITPDATCEVRVIQASIRDSRIAVVNRLVTLKNGGCKVYVVADTVEPQAKAALLAASIPVRHKPIHDKSFIVHARYGAAYEHRVYTGSHNLSGGSAHEYDEIFVKLAAETDAAHPVYDAYSAHFQDAYDDAIPVN